MPQSVQLSTATFGLFWFVLWTVFSFFAHFFARTAIKSGNTEVRNQEWISVFLLTIVQLSVGGVVLKAFVILANKGMFSSLNESQETKRSGDITGDEPRSEPSSLSMYVAHALATLSTNASIAFVNTGSAFTIKAFEPITTAVLTSMLLGSKLQTHVIISLPLVVSGALGFVWQPSLQSGATFGLAMAFVSNILFGVRNINLKLLQQESPSIKAKLELLQTASFIAAGVLVAMVALLIGVTQMPKHFDIFDSLISAFFHVTYTIISTCIILKYTSVVGHATSNLLKRILVAAVFYFIGKTVLTSNNWLMGGVMLVGLAIYMFPKACPFSETNASLSLITVVTAVVVLISTVSPITTPSLSSSAAGAMSGPNVVLPPLNLERTLSDRKRELAADKADNVHMQLIKSYEDPTKANLQSIKARDTNTLIKEAYRLHEEVFTHIIGRYKKAVLVNVFQWFNKGDHLITIGQRRILQRMGIELVYHCFYPGRECDFSGVNKDDPELVVLIQGAGYIGHPSHEFVCTTTVENFPNNRVMVFPISVCHPIAPCTEIAQFAKIFAKHSDVHVVLRDRYSYDLAEQYFTTTHNYLAPDSAFAVGSIRMNIVPVYDIVWLKRDDWESQGDAMPQIPPGIKVEVTDWKDEWMSQKSENFWEDHQLRTMTGVAFLARAKVVVSDRLHAHIMSQLMGKLNVVINSETKKQEHYYMTWEQSVNTSVLVNNNAEALTEALKLLKLYDKTLTLV